MTIQPLSGNGYHWSFSHIRNRISPHGLDFNIYPLPFKSYDIQNPFDLIDMIVPPALAGKGIDQTHVSFETLSAILYLSYGVTASRGAGPIPFLYRTIPSAGGLYPCHLYVGIQSQNTGETGVFYYDPPHGRLIAVRRGKGDGNGDFPLGLSLDLNGGDTLFFTVTASFFNSAWKYRNRAFRYLLLDSGHLAENLEIVLDHYGVGHHLFYDFDDQGVADFLGIDLSWEVPMVCVSTGRNKTVSGVMDSLGLGTSKSNPGVSMGKAQADVLDSHGVLQEIYTAGTPIKKASPFSPVEAKKQGGKTLALPGQGAAPIDLPSLVPGILTRRSRRNFVPDQVSEETQQALFSRISCGWECLSLPDRPGEPLLTLKMIVQNLDGMDDGFYLFSRDGTGIHPVDTGAFARLLAHVCLDQQWIGLAAINFLFVADIGSLDLAFGPRGYRYAMFGAGRMAQQIYLGAEGLGLGCCGIGAFYDLEAQKKFDLGKGSALLYAVSAGPVKKRIKTNS